MSPGHHSSMDTTASSAVSTASELLANATAWVSENPLVAAVIAGVILLLLAARARPDSKDDQRLFSAEQKRVIHARAGGQCEHKAPLGWRCRQPGTHADHIYPHSRGGMTILPNGQSLCQQHNLRKSAHVPSRVYVWRLERRRRRYFPAGQEIRVVRAA